MFGFKIGDKVRIKNNPNYTEGVILRQVTARACYIVRVKDGKEIGVDRNDLVRID